MKNKTLYSFVILSLLSHISCSTTTQLTEDEFIYDHTNNGIYREINLITKDSIHYHFLRDLYIVENDTLYGKGETINKVGKKELFTGGIAMKDIVAVEGYNYSPLGPLLFIGIIISFVAIAHFIFGPIIIIDMN